MEINDIRERLLRVEAIFRRFKEITILTEEEEDAIDDLLQLIDEIKRESN